MKNEVYQVTYLNKDNGTNINIGIFRTKDDATECAKTLYIKDGDSVTVQSRKFYSAEWDGQIDEPYTLG